MKTLVALTGLSLAVWMMVLSGTAVADSGAGVCVAGIGAGVTDLNDPPLEALPEQYVGVNVAFPLHLTQGPIPVTNPVDQTTIVTLFPEGFEIGGSDTGVYDTSSEFESQCCAETGAPPDCFAPIE